MDRKEQIKKIIDNMRKNTHIKYKEAVTTNQNNPPPIARQHKQIVKNKKILSNDRFMQYLKDLSKK